MNPACGWETFYNKLCYHRHPGMDDLFERNREVDITCYSIVNLCYTVIVRLYWSAKNAEQEDSSDSFWSEVSLETKYLKQSKKWKHQSVGISYELSPPRGIDMRLLSGGFVRVLSVRLNNKVIQMFAT